MRRSTFVIISVFMSLIIAGLVLAVGLDDRGNPNDPRVNERANACFEGGSMEGKCHEAYEWEAGWYLIRFEVGLISREQVPEQYAWTLPEVSISDNQDDPAPTPRPR